MRPEEAAAELLRRRMARQGLLAFTRYTFPGYRPAAHHQIIADTLDAVERGEKKRVMIFMPPRHGKSELSSRRFPAYFLGRNPERNIIAASYNSDFAADFGRDVRSIVASDEYRALFNVSLAQDSKAANRWHTEKRGMYVAVGVGAATTGRGAHVLSIDDVTKNREEADSEVIREKTWRWYTSTAYTRLESDIDPNDILDDDWLWRDFQKDVDTGRAEPFEGAIILTMTRWHEDDLGGRLLKQQNEGGEQWEVLELPAIRIENEEENPLWPSKYPLARLQKIRKVIGARDWSALYQQAPAPDEGLYFQREWFRYCDTIPRHLRFYGASDYATKDGEGDYTVHVVIGIDPDDNFYVVDLWRNQSNASVWVDAFCSMVRQYKPHMWGEEAGQMKASLEPFIKKRMLETKSYCARQPLPSSHDKRARARALQGRMSMGKVYFPKGAPWLPDLESELLAFDAGRNDDQVDALGLAARLLDVMAKGQGPKAPAKPVDRWEQTEREYASDDWKVA